MATLHLNTQEFLEKISNYHHTNYWQYLGEKPCIIDFYTSWCKPCKTIAPLLEEVSIDYAELITVYKINVDEEPELANAFGIRSLPTLIFCPINDTPSIILGSISKQQLIEQIEATLLYSLEFA